MKVRAISVASSRSDIVGTLEIECNHLGMTLTYLDAARVTAEGVPVPIERGQSLRIPWSNVKDPCFFPDAISFRLLPAPHDQQRVLLARFAAGGDLSPRRMYRRRLVARGFFLAAAALVAPILFGVFAYHGWLPTWRVRLVVGALLGLATLLAGLLLDGAVTGGRRASDIVRELFEEELTSLLPGVPRTPVMVTTERLRWPKPERIAGRATAGVTAWLLGLLAVGTFVTWEPTRIVLGQPVAQPADDSQAGQGSEPPLPPALGRLAGPCQCDFDDTPSASGLLPRVTLLATSRHTTRKFGHSLTEMDLVAINNSDSALFDLTSAVEFFDAPHTAETRPKILSRRPVHHDGPLMPGQAIKWSLSAEGSEYRLTPLWQKGTHQLGFLGPHGEGSAPPSAFLKLLGARTPEVRVHAAIVLHMLKSPRARSAILELAASMPEARDYLTRMAASGDDLQVCRLSVVGEGAQKAMSLCIANVGQGPIGPVALTLRALDRPIPWHDASQALLGMPTLLQEWTLRPGVIGAREGVSVEAMLDLSGLPVAPSAFDAYPVASFTK